MPMPDDDMGRRDLVVLSAVRRIDPNQPRATLLALAIIAGAFGVEGEVDEHALTLRLREPTAHG